MMMLANFFPFLYVIVFLSGALASNTDMPLAEYTMVNGDLYKVDGSDSVAASSVAASNAGPMSVSRVDRQKTVWEAVNSFESYKTSSLYESVNGVKTLTNFKYMILPIWWSDEVTSQAMDPEQIRSTFEQNNQYYKDMSWNKVDVTYEILPQTIFTISKADPDFGETDDAARAILDTMGKVEGRDYDGVCLVYNVADAGVFSGGGGWANVNGSFMWNSYQVHIEVIRHEIGHNFGHPHHLSNSYTYRNTRPLMKAGEGNAKYDGFDMMSGGNNVPNSKNPHIAVASKWFYNWVEDSSIVHMQPEGSTVQCPGCLSSGTFTLTPFDNQSVIPDSSTKMGIHIPIMAIGNTVYSYWLSYRGTGYDGAAAGGLSVHLSWYRLGGIFGATYDSQNYDAIGNTRDTTSDSFVTNNSCYYIFPGGFMKDQDYGSSIQVQPVVCVNSIDVGNSITVTVDFIDADAPPSPQVSPVKTTLDCTVSGSSITLEADASDYNLIHVQNAGADGIVEMKMCATVGAVFEGYFYDSFPHSLITYGSNAAHGSYEKITSTACPSNSPTSYQSDYGETYIAILPVDGVNAKATVEVSCSLSQCLWNSFLSNGVCVQCPNNGVSVKGSTSLSDCEPCPGGTYLEHPLSAACTISEDYQEITSSKGWRLWAHETHTVSGWAWDVQKLEYYSSGDCSGSNIVSDGTALDSGNAGSGWGPERAFSGGTWGGREDTFNHFYIGMMFDSTKVVRCVKYTNFGDKPAIEVRVQAYNEIDEVWENAYIQKDLDLTTGAIHIIPLGYSSSPSVSPSKAPTRAPVSSPSVSPSKATTTKAPVSSPSVSPSKATTTKAPVSSPSVSPSEAPTTKAPVITNCVDSPLKMKFNGKKKSCAWVSKKQTLRCPKPGVSSHCPGTCGVGCSEDSKKKFIHPNGKTKSCEWVAQKNTKKRCNKAGIAITCLVTCAPYV